MSSCLLLLIVHAIECQPSLYSSGIGIVIGLILEVVGACAYRFVDQGYILRKTELVVFW